MNKPEWLEEKDDGTHIKLAKAIDIDGVAIATLVMREPTVDDQLSATKSKGDDAEREITLFANLCEVSPAEIRKLSLRDYKRVQRAFVDFTD